MSKSWSPVAVCCVVSDEGTPYLVSLCKNVTINNFTACHFFIKQAVVIKGAAKKYMKKQLLLTLKVPDFIKAYFKSWVPGRLILKFSDNKIIVSYQRQRKLKPGQLA